MNKKKPKMKKRIGMLFILIITVFAGINIFNQYRICSLLDKQIQNLNDVIYKAKEEQVELKQKQQYYQTDEYIEDQAREKFGLVGEDETIYIITEE